MRSTDPQRWSGPERRQCERTAFALPRVLGRARVRSEHARHAVALDPRTWYPVTEPPADMLTRSLEGYVWIALDRPRHVWAAHLEVELDAEG